MIDLFVKSVYTENMNGKYDPFQNFTLPSFREIPDVGLYLDQVVKYINGWFEGFPDMNVTSTMLTNYVKLRIVSRTGKKTYSRAQIALFIFIAMSKSVLSMDNIRMIAGLNKDEEPEKFYSSFRESMLGVLRSLAAESDSLDRDGSTVSNICIAIGHKMYLELYFGELKNGLNENTEDR